MTAAGEGMGLKFGMVGGGEGSFIGDVHRKAIGLTGKAEIVCGCFDINRENNLKSGLMYGIPENRIYKDFAEMADAEASTPEKIDFVTIATPNNLHYPIAKEFLSKGFNVVCEKPLCFEPDEGLELQKLAEEKGCLFGMTYTYIGYPMVKQARQMVRTGAIGEIVEVIAEYAQDWLAEHCQKTDGNPVAWRNDPKIAGKSGCVGDIGSHIECTVAYITGLKIEAVSANLRAAGKGVKLDSIGEILVRFNNGASGIYWCSQMAYGYNNGLRIRIFGTKGSLEWVQEDPCKLKMTVFGEPTHLYTQGKGYLDGDASRYCRLPAGHPEGFYEAFANIYSAFADALVQKKSGRALADNMTDFAGINEGISGVRFINGCIESSQNNSVWMDL